MATSQIPRTIRTPKRSHARGLIIAPADGPRSGGAFFRPPVALLWPHDLDIANVLIRKHGKGAALEAAQRADAMLECGDMSGYTVWKRIVRAVEELQRKEPREGEAAH